MPAVALTMLSVFSVAIDRFDVPAALEDLTAPERARAGRFRHQGARRAFIVMRHALRRVLADRLGVAAGEVAVLLSGYGKPSVASGPFFCLSHSADKGLLAISEAGPIGVDIEQPNRLNESDDPIALARTAFHPREVDWLTSLPVSARMPAFYAIWCRREALLKAAGVGIAVDPSCLLTDSAGQATAPVWFQPPIGPADEEWRRHAAAGQLTPSGGPDWWVRDLEVDGIPAAIAGIGDMPSDDEIVVEDFGSV
jgi:phosphopantetheinyl transferase